MTIPLFVAVYTGYFYSMPYVTACTKWFKTQQTHLMVIIGIVVVLYMLASGGVQKTISVIANSITLPKKITKIREKFTSSAPETKTKRNVTALMKKKVAASQEWKCSICSAVLDETYEVDHVLALDHGGTNSQSNLRALCPHCHRKKTVDEQLNPPSLVA